MNFKKLTIAAAIVAMSQPQSSYCPIHSGTGSCGVRACYV